MYNEAVQILSKRRQKEWQKMIFGGTLVKTKERNPYDPPHRVGAGRIIFYIFAILVILVLALILVQVAVTRSSGEPPCVFGYRLFLMEDDSMGETIKKGEAILVHQQDADAYQPGDVITYRAGADDHGNWIITSHRIMEIQQINGDPVFVTQADTVTDQPDGGWRTVDDIYGEVTLVMPWLGSFFTFLDTPFGLVICIAVPLGVLLILEIINLTVLSRRSGRDEEAEEADRLTRAARGWKAAELPADEFGFDPKSNEEWGFAENSAFSAEPEDVPLQKEPMPAQATTPFQRRAFGTPKSTDSIYATREFDVPNPEPTKPAVPVIQPDLPPLEEKKPVKEAERVEAIPPKEEKAVLPAAAESASEAKESPDFQARMASHGQDRFQIDGIDVCVRPDSIDLLLPENQKEREISITVTNDCTDVTIGSKGNEVNFALFREKDADGQKVVIRKRIR